MTQRGKISLLLFFFAVCATAALVSHYIERRPYRVEPGELYAVIYKQIRAFRADDYSSAYRQASLEFQQRFTVDQFTDMIRNEYPGVAHAEHVEFGLVECHGKRALIQVFFVDKLGEVTPCIYTLVAEGEGWKVDGARLMQHWMIGQRLSGVRT